MVSVAVLCIVAIGAFLLYGKARLASSLPVTSQQKPVAPLVGSDNNTFLLKKDQAANHVLLQGTVIDVKQGSMVIQLPNASSQSVALGSNTKFFKRTVNADYVTKDTAITIQDVKKGSPVLVVLDSPIGEATVVYMLASS